MSALLSHAHSSVWVQLASLASLEDVVAVPPGAALLARRASLICGAGFACRASATSIPLAFSPAQSCSWSLSGLHCHFCASRLMRGLSVKSCPAAPLDRSISTHRRSGSPASAAGRIEPRSAAGAASASAPSGPRVLAADLCASAARPASRGRPSGDANGSGLSLLRRDHREGFRGLTRLPADGTRRAPFFFCLGLLTAPTTCLFTRGFHHVISGIEGIFLGMKDESEIAGHATRSCFCWKHPQSSKRGFWRWHAVQQHQKGPVGGVEREIVIRVQLDVRAAIPERQAPPLTTGEQLSRRVYIRRSVELVTYGYTDRCIGCWHARLGLQPADHSEECRAGIVRYMTADDDLNQRVQFAQHRIVETAPSEARAGERDPVREPVRKKVRFAERVGEQTPVGTVVTNSLSTRDRKSHTEQVWNWTGWSRSLSSIVSNDTPTVVFWCKSSKTQMRTLTKLFFKVAKREKL